MAKKYSFACKDIGMACGFKASAGSEGELMGKVMEHGKAAHNMANVDSATMAKIKAAVKME